MTATVTATAEPSGGKRRRLHSTGRKLQQSTGTIITYIIVTLVPPGATATNVGDITKQVGASLYGQGGSWNPRQPCQQYVHRLLAAH